MYVRADRPAFARPYVGVHYELVPASPVGDISTLDGTPLKLVDKFTYLGSSVASTEKDLPKLVLAYPIVAV